MTTPLPLAGTRVIDITVVWAGPWITQMMADLGAEVIKVENVHVWQGYTRSLFAHPRKEDFDEHSPEPRGFPGHDPAGRAWERDPWCLPLLRNKKSVTINLLTERGRDYLYRLVAKSDVVVENNAPSTIERIGATYEDLVQHRPDLVMFRAPAYGLSGPYKYRRGYGNHIESVIGHSLLRGYEGDDPQTNTAINAGDFMTAANGLFAVLAALYHRDRTGEGQLIEMAQAEDSSHMFPQALMDYLLNGHVRGTIGNHDVEGYAPNGVYPCRGDDRWIAITVTSDDEWRALCAAAGHPEFAGLPEFATFDARERDQAALDRLVASWTVHHEAMELAATLQAAGVAAGPVMDPRDALASPQLRERGFWQTIEHRFTGSWEWPGRPFSLPGVGYAPSLPPPGLGEHNEYVYRDLLGVSQEEYDKLVSAGEIGTEFDASIP